MTPLITADKSSHWYRYIQEQGTYESFYEIECTTIPGKYRAPDIDDAKRLGLLYAVTRISGIIPRPRLQNYKEINLVLAALTLPMEENEPLDDYANRCVDDAQRESKEAIERGKRIHKAIEQWLLDHVPPEPELLPLVSPVMDWAKNLEVISAEEIVGDYKLGYAGRLDLRCVVGGLFDDHECVVDFKTQKVKKNAKGQPKPMFWNDWPIQLAGYGHCVAQTGWPRLINVIVNTDEPGIYTKEWTDYHQYWATFQQCLEILKYSTGYAPPDFAPSDQNQP